MPPRVLSRINSACGHVISAERVFLRRLSHKPFANICGARLSVRKNPIRGFFVLCGHERGTKQSDFGFGRHEASGKAVSRMGYFCYRKVLQWRL